MLCLKAIKVVVQDLDLHTDNVKFRKEKFYSPSRGEIYLAELPPGYTGQFGPGVKVWVLDWYYAAGMTEPKILELLQTIGMQISAGQLSDFLIKDQHGFQAEEAAVLQAGLASSKYQHLDSTQTDLNGEMWQCHVLCNPLYTAYRTLPTKDRLALVKVLLAGHPVRYRLDELTWELLTEFKLAAKWQKRLRQAVLVEDEWSETELDQFLKEHLAGLGPNRTKVLKDALAITYYRTQKIVPVVEVLACDDAPQFNYLTPTIGLCWIHEARKYKKLEPKIGYHRKRLKEFQDKFWKLYRKLLAYAKDPDERQKVWLEQEFDRIFGETSDYEQLDKRKALTLAKKEQLLTVLYHPEVPLHNNPAELGARQRVRKRDVSLQARTAGGLRAWDIFGTLLETAKKLGVNSYQYLRDRLTKSYQMPSLANLILVRSQTSL